MKNKNTDNEKYIQSHTIADTLVDNILNDKTRDEEEIAKFLNDSNNVMKLQNSLDRADKIEERLSAMTDEKRMRDTSNLLRRIETEKANRNFVIRRKIIVSIAVASALIALSFLVFKEQESSSPVLSYQTNDKITVPTLIIEDGENIRLDSVVNLEGVAVVENNKIKYSNKIEEVKYNTIVVPAGYTYNVELADGSKVFINAGGELRYPTAFNGETREVELKGEAYFEITKSTKPMYVKTKYSTVRVYGTKFNVNASEQFNFVETVLVEGSVGVVNGEDSEVMIKPNQRISYDVSSRVADVQSVNAYDYIAWKEGVFKYTDVSMLRVLNDISNWYGVGFDVKKEIGDIIITVDINRDMNVDSVMEVLDLMVKDVKIIKERGGVYAIE